MAVLTRREDQLLLIKEAEGPHNLLAVCAGHADAIFPIENPPVLRRACHEGQLECLATTRRKKKKRQVSMMT